MTHQEINQAIAEACGWTDVQVGTLSKELIGKSPTDGDYWPIASYVSDLNAMWEAEETIYSHHKMWLAYYNAVGAGPFSLHVTARKKAEAFLKVIGKWEVQND